MPIAVQLLLFIYCSYPTFPQTHQTLTEYIPCGMGEPAISRAWWMTALSEYKIISFLNIANSCNNCESVIFSTDTLTWKKCFRMSYIVMGHFLSRLWNTSFPWLLTYLLKSMSSIVLTTEPCWIWSEQQGTFFHCMHSDPPYHVLANILHSFSVCNMTFVIWTSSCIHVHKWKALKCQTLGAAVHVIVLVAKRILFCSCLCTVCSKVSCLLCAFYLALSSAQFAQRFQTLMLAMCILFCSCLCGPCTFRPFYYQVSGREWSGGQQIFHLVWHLPHCPTAPWATEVQKHLAQT